MPQPKRRDERLGALGSLAAGKQISLSGQTVSHLTDYILSGRVVSGDLLPSEAELCRSLEISRAPLREAISVLEARGLVQRRHGIGIQVTDRSHEAAVASLGLMLQRNGSRLTDLLEARVGLESLIAELAAVRATSEEVQALGETIGPMRNASSTVEEYVAADLSFHLQLAAASHNIVLSSFVNIVRDLLLQSIRASYTVDGHTERRLRDHTQVLEAVQQHHPENARAAMCEHLHHSEEVLRHLGLIMSAEVTLLKDREAGSG